MSALPKHLDPKYRERSRIQCLAWAEGRSYHEPINDECTPDFSCCFPSLFEADASERWRYYHRRFGRQQ